MTDRIAQMVIKNRLAGLHWKHTLSTKTPMATDQIRSAEQAVGVARNLDAFTTDGY